MIIRLLSIGGCSAVGGAVGFGLGLVHGFREGGDFNFAPAIYGPFFGMFGAIGGAVIGAALFS